MTKPATTSRWYQPWRSAEAPAPIDPADLGTCFGLELSLTPEPTPAKPAPARRRGWMQRLTTKRGAAA